MAYAKLLLRPGVNRQFTPTLNEAGISFSDLIRFQNGLPQKLGGWVRLSDDTIIGTASGMHAWGALNGNAYLAIGSEQRLAIYFGGLVYDITPIRDTANISPQFSTTIGSPTVNIRDVAHGGSTGDWVVVLTAVSVGGLIIQGFYQMTLVDVDNYTITATSNATALVVNGGAVSLFNTTNTLTTVLVTLANHGFTTGDVYTVHVSTVVGGITLFGEYVVTVLTANTFNITATVASSTTSGSENGGNVRLQYLLASGYASNTPLAGYGVGDYGAGDYGLSSDSSDLIAPLRQWSMDNWGEFWVGCPTQGAIYYWDPPIAVDNVAVLVSGAPTINTGIFVMMPAQILVATGTDVSGTFDPNLVRWCDVSDFNDWTATVTNQAGSFRIPTGSRIVGNMLATQQGLIWTDTDLWSMQYQGLPFVFGFNKIGSNCGLIGLRAAAMIGSTVVWMSLDNFFSYSGGTVQTIECSVWDVVFNNLDTSQLDKICAWTNSLFNEIWWFFPSLDGGGNIDSYVKYSIYSGLWDYGSMVRTAVHEGGVLGGPVGVDGSHLIQQHERGNDADGEPMSPSFQTGFFDIADGEDFSFVDQMIPDVNSNEGTRLKITVYARDYPEGSETSQGPITFRVGHQDLMSLRIRGRQFSIAVASNDLGSRWRLGAFRYRIAQDGRR